MGRRRKAKRAAKESARRTINNRFDVIKTSRELQNQFEE